MRENLTCGFIGLGLIGGSIAKALRQFHPDYKLIGYDIQRENTDLAVEEGILNISLSEIDASFHDCDYIFLCAPVSFNDENLIKLKQFLSPDCLLTDVGSVKTDIHSHIESLGLNAQFIGGHPMAGSERTGYINSKAILIENAYYILTPTREVAEEKITEYKELAASLGAIPLILSCDLHDYVTAAVSHLPHVIAASLVNLVRDKDSGNGIMKLIAAGGFKDITRIASSSPSMWQQICLTNTENISALLDDYIASLIEIRSQIEQHRDLSVYHFFDDARSYRDSFMDASSGPIKRSFTVNIEIADEPGALASIATILALNQISIKNIGIVHNREQQDGVLQIEFYEEDSIRAAGEILEHKGYVVHQGP
ncbi:MAG: prephenate dehydrogenase [Lachnospiraceae bacterium]|nr:prephenate dehydrogenase [Lachnospiraceae bacterium]MBD5456005.1 prephenate dehydrogenase [Lachnospiraceae bacterium]